MEQNPEVFVEKVVLADGTEFLATAGANQDNELWIWFDEPVDFITLANVFSDSEKTETITVKISKYNTKVYDNFTSLACIQKRSGDGKMIVQLNKVS